MELPFDLSSLVVAENKALVGLVARVVAAFDVNDVALAVARDLVHPRELELD